MHSHTYTDTYAMFIDTVTLRHQYKYIMLKHSNITDASSHSLLKIVYIWTRWKDFSAKIYQLNVNGIYLLTFLVGISRCTMFNMQGDWKFCFWVFHFEELYIRNLRFFLLKTLVNSDLQGSNKIVSYEHVLISKSIKWKLHLFYYRNVSHRTLNRKHISFRTLILSVKK